MKEYVVIEIRCKNNLKLADAYDFIKGKVKYNSNFFELLDLFRFSRKVDTNIHRKYDELGLKEFAYIKVLEHLANNPHYNSERDDRKVISNLDSRWNWHNSTSFQSLPEEQLFKLVHFCDSLKSSDVSSLMIGIDEIEWDNQKPSKGTYGFDKAQSTYSLGRNYLSNSIIIGRAYDSKNYTAYVSYEKRVDSDSVINKIKDIIDFLGQINNERIYFAPENELERSEWTNIYEEASFKFNKMVSGIKSLGLVPVNSQKSSEKNKFDIKKYIKKYLCTDGWNVGKKNPGETGTKICIEKGGNCLSLYIVSGHNGHHLQLLVYYDSIRFSFGKNLCFSFSSSSESDLDIYFKDVKTIRDYVYSTL